MRVKIFNFCCISYIIAMTNSKSRSTHSLANTNPQLNSNNINNNNEQGFYQNLSVYRNQNQSQPILSER